MVSDEGVLTASVFPYASVGILLFAGFAFVGQLFKYAPYGGTHRGEPWTFEGFGAVIHNDIGWGLLELPGVIFVHFHLFSLVLSDSSDTAERSPYALGITFRGTFDSVCWDGYTGRDYAWKVLLYLSYLVHYLWRSVGMSVYRQWRYAQQNPPVKTEWRFPVVLWLSGWLYIMATSMGVSKVVCELGSGLPGDGSIEDGWRVVGFVLWGVFFALNVAVDWELIRLKAQSGGYHVDIQSPTVQSWFLRFFPIRFLSQTIACPNYFFEVFEWLAWGLAAGSFVGVWFGVGTALILTPRAVWRAHWYTKTRATVGFPSPPGTRSQLIASYGDQDDLLDRSRRRPRRVRRGESVLRGEEKDGYDDGGDDDDDAGGGGGGALFEAERASQRLPRVAAVPSSAIHASPPVTRAQLTMRAAAHTRKLAEQRQQEIDTAAQRKRAGLHNVCNALI